MRSVTITKDACLIIYCRIGEVAPMCSNTIQRYVQDVCKVATLTCEEQQALAKRVHAGDQDDRSKLLQSNLRLVQDIGKQYINRGIPFLDIIEKRNIGLIRAVEQFGQQRGIKFCTLASWWITRTITRALANHIRVIGLPIQFSELTTVYTCTIRKLMQQLAASQCRERRKNLFPHRSAEQVFSVPVLEGIWEHCLQSCHDSIHGLYPVRYEG